MSKYVKPAPTVTTTIESGIAFDTMSRTDRAATFLSSKPGFAIQRTKLVRELDHFNFGAGSEGFSIGQVIESAIEDALRHGDEMQELRFMVEPDSWKAMQEAWTIKERNSY